jgi:Holliday junction resolvase RusA-like endonuclease
VLSPYAQPIRIVLEGKPIGRKEPIITRKGPYPQLSDHKTTREGKKAWLAAWRAAGSPRLPGDGPIAARLTVLLERPPTHLLRDGVSLSAEGRRWPMPSMKPDLSNVLKLAEDALKGHAFGDDCRIVAVLVSKDWAPPGTPASTTFALSPFHPPSQEAAA